MIDTTIAADELRSGSQDLRRHTGILLACGVVAGPLYLVTAAAQVATRDGFDLTRHPLSLLSLGDLGWIQVANFVVSGALYVAAAVGLRRVLRSGRGGTWAPRMLGAFGGSLIWAGVFPADPYRGFPAGAPDDTTVTSWHGLLHNLAPAVGFLALVVACLVLARRFRADGRRGWALGSAVTAVLLLAPDLFLAQDYFTAVLVAAAVLGWSWASAVSARLLLDLRT